MKKILLVFLSVLLVINNTLLVSADTLKKEEFKNKISVPSITKETIELEILHLLKTDLDLEEDIKSVIREMKLEEAITGLTLDVSLKRTYENLIEEDDTEKEWDELIEDPNDVTPLANRPEYLTKDDTPIINYIYDMYNKSLLLKFYIENLTVLVNMESDEEKNVADAFAVADTVQKYANTLHALAITQKEKIPEELYDAILVVSKDINEGKETTGFKYMYRALYDKGGNKSATGIQADETQLAGTTSAFDGKGVLDRFINLSTKYYTQEILKGQAVSATYIPLQTNIYDMDMLGTVNDDKFSAFHIKFGGLRKALNIATDPNAVTKFVTSKGIGSTRTATLKDLLNSKYNEVLLTVDDGMYNMELIKNSIGNTTTKDNIIPELNVGIDTPPIVIDPTITPNENVDETVESTIEEDEEDIPEATTDLDHTKWSRYRDVDQFKSDATFQEALKKLKDNTLDTLENMEIYKYVEEKLKAWSKDDPLSKLDNPFLVQVYGADVSVKSFVKAVKGDLDITSIQTEVNKLAKGLTDYEFGDLKKISYAKAKKLYNAIDLLGEEVNDKLNNKGYVTARALAVYCIIASNEYTKEDVLLTPEDFVCVIKMASNGGSNFLPELTKRVFTGNVQLATAIETLKNLQIAMLDKSMHVQDFEKVNYQVLTKEVFGKKRVSGLITPEILYYVYSTGDTSSIQVIESEVEALKKSADFDENIISVIKTLSDFKKDPLSSVTSKTAYYFSALSLVYDRTDVRARIGKTGIKAGDLDKERVNTLLKLLDLNSIVKKAETSGLTKEITDLSNLLKDAKDIFDFNLDIDLSRWNPAETSAKLQELLKQPIAKDIQGITSTDVNADLTTDETQGAITSFLDGGAALNQPVGIQASILMDGSLDALLADTVIKSIDDYKVEVNHLLGLAVTRDIYANPEIASIVATSQSKPIWISSKNSKAPIPAGAAYNAMLLENIQYNRPIRYDIELDMSSPIFIDIYGNIVTESGLVVIPAAANGTFHDKYNPMTAAFLLNYDTAEIVEYLSEDGLVEVAGNKLNLPETFINDISAYNVVRDTIPVITADFAFKYMNLNPSSIEADIGTLTINKYNSKSLSSVNMLYKLNEGLYIGKSGNTAFQGEESILITPLITSRVIYEVLRGSTLSNLDYNAEGIIPESNINSGLLKRAVQLEDLKEATSSIKTNTILSMPDLSFLPGIEYVMFFLMRLVLIAFLLYFIFYVYFESAGGKLNLMTIPKVFIAFLLLVIVAVITPNIVNGIYYNINVALFQREAMTVTLLNEEKRTFGIELGVLDATKEPQLSTTLLKVKDIEVPWYYILKEGILNPDLNTLSGVYEKYLLEDSEYSSGSYVVKNKSLYIDVATLFESSEIVTDKSSNQLMQISREDNPIGFRLPYYAMVDYIIANVNSYNNSIDSFSFDTINTIDSRERTVGLASRYFKSNSFRIHRKDIINNRQYLPQNIDLVSLETALYDRSGVFQFYGSTTFDDRDLFSNSKSKIQNSLWYVDDLSDARLNNLADELDTTAINFIKDNNSLLNRITDENLIKSLALTLALEYNEMLRIAGPNKLELTEVSIDDLVRFTVMDRDEVIYTSPYTYSKILVDKGGSMSIFVGAALDIAMFMLSFVKPVAMLIIILSAILSVVFYRLLNKDNNNQVKGFFKVLLVTVIVNTLFSVTLKLLVMIGGFSTIFINLLILFCIVVLLITFYIRASLLVIFNWKDFGNDALTTAVKIRSIDSARIKQYRDKVSEDNLVKNKRIDEYKAKLEEIDNER